jgi:RecB family exonuclease
MGRLGATLRGQIDLVVRHASGALTLVDYKTSRIAKAQVAEKAADFELQLRIYALAARELFGRAPARACLHFLHPDAVAEVDVSPAALASAERAIEAFFTAHLGSSFPQSPARHCFSCGYLRAYCANLDRAALEAATAAERA